MNQETMKRGPGRPKKTDNQNQTTSNQSHNNFNNTQLPVKTAGLKLTFTTLFDFIGKYLANVTMHEGFKVTQIECEMLGDQADQVCAEFIPPEQSKWAKLLIFIVSIVGTYGSRYFEYERRMREKFKAKENEKNGNSANIVNLPQSAAMVVDR